MNKTLPLFLAVCLAAIPALAAPEVDNALLEILVSYQENDPFVPWRKRQPGRRIGYGVVIDKGLVLTTESLVRSHTLVELRRAARGEKIPARV